MRYLLSTESSAGTTKKLQDEMSIVASSIGEEAMFDKTNESIFYDTKRSLKNPFDAHTAYKSYAFKLSEYHLKKVS